LKYFPDSPPKEYIHIIVEPLISTATSSREQKLLDQVTSLQVLLNKSVHGMYKAMGKVERLRKNISNRPLYYRI
jgi:hypothetical protein